jgi:OFA family oxalate/formate antiporter-like MFS transporter
MQRAFARGVVVTLAGLGINLALGVLYSWSVVAKELVKSWEWSTGQASLPYAVACGVFAASMVVAGRLQDRFGPRIVAAAGGVLTGLGLIVASLAGPTQLWLVVLGFGVLAGAGIGLGYAAATPAAVKWFPKARTGMVTGIVVAGFGLASVYIAPLTTYLLHSRGVSQTFLILGGAFGLVVVVLAQLLVNPPADIAAEIHAADAPAAAAASGADYGWREMVGTSTFKVLWVMYAFASFAGLMIIGHMAKIAGGALPGVDLGFVLVAVLAVGNASGRVIAGTVSDRIGRTPTMIAVFVLQAIMMGVLAVAASAPLLLVAAALIGFAYGANLAVFPSATAAYFGRANLGVNYGIVFTAWGVGGVFGSMTAGAIFDATHSYLPSFGIAALLCLAAAGLTFVLRAPGERTAAAAVAVDQG